MDSETIEVRRAVKDVPGWLAESEGELLFNLAKNCVGKGVIVEIGSWKGRSTIWLAKGSRAGHGVKIYAVDPHANTPGHRRQGEQWTYDEFKRNIVKAGIADLVVPLVSTSETAASDFAEPVEMIFIDGDHEYESVRRDFELWFPKVIENGVMAFHDTTNWEGPRKLVTERIYKSRTFSDASLVCSITSARKVRENTFWQRLRNRLALLAKNCVGLSQVVGERYVRTVFSKAERYWRSGVRAHKVPPGHTDGDSHTQDKPSPD